MTNIPLSKTFFDTRLAARDFGENRVKDLELRLKLFLKGLPRCEMAFIKPQSNKLNQLLKVKNLCSIHSIDSLKLLEKLYEKAPQHLESQNLSFFLQVKTSDEDEKSGFNSKEDVYKALNLVQNKKVGITSLNFLGFMTMGKVRTEDFEQEAAKCFQGLVDLRAVLNDFSFEDLKLSMGMSQDYKIALAMEVTLLGSAALFSFK